MRTAYHEQLLELDAQVGDMCGRAGLAMKQATRALLDADVAFADQVIGDQEQMVAKRARADQDAFALLALQQPVAGELRDIVSTIQIIADAERMGALAVHVAQIVRRRLPQRVLPEPLNGCFADMGAVAIAMGECAGRALTISDAGSAARLREDDDAMNCLHRRLFTILLGPAWEYGVTAAVDAALLGRFYERFADHAVQVGRRVVFKIIGALPREQQIDGY